MNNKSRIVLFILMVFLWAALTWDLSWQNLLTGVLVSMFIAWITGDLFTPNPHKFLRAGCYVWFCWYLLVLFFEMCKAGALTVYRVLRPTGPERTGIVKIRTTLKNETALTFLANSLLLGQEAVAVDVDREGSSLTLHCFDTEAGRDNGALVQSVRKFEHLLGRVFE